MEKYMGRREGSSRGRGYGGPFGNTNASARSSTAMHEEDPNSSHEEDINLRSLREQLPSFSKAHYSPSPQNPALGRRSNNWRSTNGHNTGGAQKSPGPSNSYLHKYGVHGFGRPHRSRGESHMKRTDENPSVVSSRESTVDEDDLPWFSGTCADMCPARERAERERLRDLAVFERLDGNPEKTSPSLAVKKFCRTISISDTRPADVRPLAVLWKTMKYLLMLVDSSEHSFDVVHEFLFDRMRAIRQELQMQKITNHRAIILHEQMVRYHILSQHKLLQCNSSNNPWLQLNTEQLSKSLVSLFDLYHINRKGSSTFVTEDQAEFYCYYVLLNLGSHGPSKGESLSAWFRGISASLVNSKEMIFARKILRCFRMGNFNGFFKLVKESTYLEACLLERHFNEVRAQALFSINQGGYKLHPFPLADLAELLMMKEPDIEGFCSLCGLMTSMDDTGVKFLMVKQDSYSFPEKGFPQHICPYIEEKRASSYCLEIMRTWSSQ